MIHLSVPADLYVFPDEYHIKWQPAHVDAANRRNVAWFVFGLKAVMPGNPVALAEAMRWQEMKERWLDAWSSSSAASP